ncbi:MAG: hypothetical protein H6Q23_1863 [Bacteroidetes bacterium]|nr:hypothetical protein [Bacteroidota bacterium]
MLKKNFLLFFSVSIVIILTKCVTTNPVITADTSGIRSSTVLSNEAEQKIPVLKPPAVKPGIEVLVEDHLDLIKGKKVGLITNPSATGSNLRSSIDILAGTPGVNLVALFGAEHGVRGAQQGRIDQEGEPDPQTGIPVYSLYGDSFAPRKEWLENLDALIFDIQGVGSAWYTFKYSMSFAMEACAKAGISFIVLDRQLVSTSNDKTDRGTGHDRRESGGSMPERCGKIYGDPFEVSAI